MTDRPYAYRLRLRRTAAGLSQRELAARSGVKQPLISAIERGNREPTAAVRHLLEPSLQVRPSQVLRVTRQEVKDVLAAVGGTNVRIVGSVATGQDEVSSDLDLIVEFPPEADIVTLLTLEDDLRALLTVPVDVISARSSGNLPASTLEESVPL
ncbi:MAG: XRE family transcriptional regulator [Actinobacteria bacterium]|nr:XRE family transcriptional regulator [Actinomycetota bacterium]